METINILLAVIFIAGVVYGFLKATINAFKIGYYEQTLKNHREKFSEEKWKCIENVMAKKWPFKL